MVICPLVVVAEPDNKQSHFTSSDRMISIIKDFEKLRLSPYKGASGKWVVGYGHLLGKTHNGSITESEAQALLRGDLKYSEAAVKRLVKSDLTQHEFDALVSLVYNIGSGAFANSTVLNRLNQGDKQGAANAFLMWNRAGGKKNKHLMHRRKIERAYFLGSQNEADHESKVSG